MRLGNDQTIKLDERLWNGVIDAAHASADDDDQAWVEKIVSTAAPLFNVRHGIALTITKHTADCTSAHAVNLAAPPLFRAMFDVDDAGLSVLGVDGFRSYYYPPLPVTTHAEIERGIPEEQRFAAEDLRKRTGLDGILGALAHPKPGVVLVLCALHDEPITLGTRERSLLTRVALHLEASYRLRQQRVGGGEEIVRAELDSEGNVLFQSPDLPQHAVQRSSQTVAAHGRGMRALDLWPALIDGHLSLIERTIAGRTRYLLIENPAAAQPFRALSKAEIDVVSLAARGLSTKLIAYALGIASPTASSLLAAAATKVGAASRIELVRLAAMLTRDPRARFSEDTFALTDAERDVLDLLRRGLTNEQIAKMRSRSVRTIANQVASLLRKTNSTSRRELVVRAP